MPFDYPPASARTNARMPRRTLGFDSLRTVKPITQWAIDRQHTLPVEDQILDEVQAVDMMGDPRRECTRSPCGWRFKLDVWLREIRERAPAGSEACPVLPV